MNRSKAFTLVEVILVVVIISLLAALVLPKVLGWGAKGRIATAAAQVAFLRTALTQFEAACGRLPTTAEGLGALIQRPAALPEGVQWERCLDESFIPKDPWGSDYVYRSPGTVNTDGYDLFSPGPDGKEGTADDIGNTRRR